MSNGEHIGGSEVSQRAPTSRFGMFVVLMNSLSGWILFFMMFLITFDVIGRYFLSRPITGTLEITEFLMVFVIFLSIACVQRRKGHIRVHLITARLSAKKEAVIDIVAHLVAAVFFLLLAWQAGVSGLSSWQYNEASEGLFQIPIYPPKFAVAAGSLLIVMQFLSDIVVLVRRVRRK